LPILQHPRDLRSAGGKPSLCREGVAVLAQSSEQQGPNSRGKVVLPTPKIVHNS
jgi:hypothetical protein